MIKPRSNSSDRLEFECDTCRAVIRNFTTLVNFSAGSVDAHPYDVRYWGSIGLEVQCPKCHKRKQFQIDRPAFLKKNGASS